MLCFCKVFKDACYCESSSYANHYIIDWECAFIMYIYTCVIVPDLGYVTIHMSLLLKEKLAISSILPLQNGGSRTPWYSKYLLSYSIGVLGVSTSLSAIPSNDYWTTSFEESICKYLGWRGRIWYPPDPDCLAKTCAVTFSQSGAGEMM